MTNRTIITDLSPFDAKQVLEFAAKRSGMTTEFTSEFQARRTKPPQVLCAFPSEGTENRHIITWALHILDASGQIEGNTLRVAPRGRISQDRRFDCLADDEGEWFQLIRTRLQTPFKADPRLIGSCEILLSAIVHDAKVPVILDPTLDRCSNLPKGFIESAQPKTCENVLAAGLAAVNGEFRIQGGVVFVTRKNGTKEPNKVSDASSGSAAEPSTHQD